MRRFLPIFLIFHALTVSAQEILSPSWTLETNVVNDGAGGLFSSCGDLNNDGYPEIITRIGQHNAYVFYGSAAGYPVAPSMTIGFPNESATAFTSGDFNNDNYDDLVVATFSTAKVYIFNGSASGISATPSATLFTAQTAGNFGLTIDGNGDINGDGYSDLLVGEPNLNRGNTLYGMAHVYYGKPGGLTNTPDRSISTIVGTLSYGAIVRFAGDVNGDNYDDVLIAAKGNYYVTTMSTEFTELFLGSASGLAPTSVWSFTGKAISVEKAYDVNADGYDDMIFGFYTDYLNKYSLVIYPGSTSINSNKELYRLETTYPYDGRGIGDFNEDGYADIAISNRRFSGSSLIRQGKVDVHMGNALGISSAPRFSYHSGIANAEMGSTGFIGDANKDGFSDFLIGLSNYSNQQSNEGRLQLFHGKSTVAPDFSVQKEIQCITGNSFKFTNLSVDATTYLWDFGDGTTSTDNSPSHTYTDPGLYTVSLKAGNTKGHSATKVMSNYAMVKPIVEGGSYTIGGATPDYTTIATANSALECGISGNVEIKIRDGIYDEQLKLEGFTSFGGNYWLTVSSENLNSSLVTISNVRLVNSKNIALKRLSFLGIEYTINPLPEQTFLIHKSQNILIDSCKIYRSYQASEMMRIDSSSSIRISRSFFANKKDTAAQTSDHTYGVVLSDSRSIKVDSCYFVLHRGYGVIAAKCDLLTIKNNYIRGITNNMWYPYSGITLTYCKGISITGNFINRAESGIGIANCSGYNGSNLIANNAIGSEIGVSYNGSYYGISLLASRNFKIYHNTVNLTKGNYNHNYALRMQNCDTIVVQNNILKANVPDAWCIAAYSVTNFHSDYNLFSGRVANSDQYYPATLKGWRDEFGQDMNSTDDSIAFMSSFVLKPIYNAASVNEAAFTIPETSTDINGQSRGLSTADLGAFNVSGDTTYYAVSTNLELVDVLTDSLYPGNNSIQFRVTNHKHTVVDSIYLHYQFDDKPVVTEHWIGTMNYSDTITYSFAAPYNSKKGKIHFLKAWVSPSSSKRDFHNYNDTIHKELYHKMKGGYTVYGMNPDFPDLKTANYHLEKCSVDSMAVMYIRPGEYTIGNFYLEKGPVVFRSSTGKPEDVILHLSRINRDNITLKKLTVLCDFGSYNGYEYMGFEITGCSNTWIDSCIISTGKSNNGLGIIGFTNGAKITNTYFKKLNAGIIFQGYTPLQSQHHGTYLIENCRFDSCKYGVLINSQILAVDLQIRRNTFKHGNSTLFFPNRLSTISNVTVEENLVDSTDHILSGTDCKFQNSVFRKNKFFCKNSVIHSASPILTKIGFYNNMMRVETVGVLNAVQKDYVCTALSINNAKDIKIYNNSFYGGIYAGTNNNGNIEVANNNFYSDSSVLYIADLYGGYFGHHNNYFRKDSGNVAYFRGNYFKQIDSLHQRYGTERFSTNVNPHYAGRKDFHALSPYLEGRGIPFPEITEDIDGEVRHSSAPDIGADEFVSAKIITSPVIASISPSPNSLGLTNDTKFTIILDRSATISQGMIKLYKSSDNSFVGDLGVASYNFSKIDSNKLTFFIPDYLESETQYYFVFEENLFVNTGMGNAEINDPLFYTFTTGLITGLSAGGKPTVSSLYPNPTSGIVHLQLGRSVTTDGAEVVIMDVLGQKVFEQTVNGSTSLNLSGLPPGMYHVSVSSDNYQDNFKLMLE